MDEDFEELLDKIEFGRGNKRRNVFGKNKTRDDNKNLNDLFSLGSNDQCFSKYESPPSKCFGKTRSCDSLRCTSCDFAVSSFDNLQWNESIDYLFLRNNMPDFNKIKIKLKKKPGCRAYACQCTWLDSFALELLKDSHPGVKWVCGKH